MDYETTNGVSIKKAFDTFHENNPVVYELFLKYAFQLLQKDKKISSKLIINRIRWEVYIETDGEPYRINDAFTAHYARLFLKDYPEHEDKIELRRIRADGDFSEYFPELETKQEVKELGFHERFGEKESTIKEGDLFRS
jgi:hypothetical protein